jgi:hypothetical protein
VPLIVLRMEASATRVLRQIDNIETALFVNDPATVFHELRRFLYEQGVETMLYSGTKVPSSFTGASTNMSMEVFSIDNAFFSEFRTMGSIDTSKKRRVVNTLVFTLRVFFATDGDGNSGTIQILLNHLHDGILDQNTVCGDLVGLLNEKGWEQNKRLTNRMSLTSNMVFSLPFSGVHDFTRMFFNLEPVLTKHNIVGSNLPTLLPY